MHSNAVDLIAGQSHWKTSSSFPFSSSSLYILMLMADPMHCTLVGLSYMESFDGIAIVID